MTNKGTIMNAHTTLRATAAQYGYDLRRNPAFDAGHMSAHDARVLTQAIIDEADLAQARKNSVEPLATDAQVSEYMNLRAELLRNGDKTFYELGIDDAQLLTATTIAAHIATANAILAPAEEEPDAGVVAKAFACKMNLMQRRAVAAHLGCTVSQAYDAIVNGIITIDEAQSIIDSM